jgi:AP endonuclease 1
MVRTSPRKKKQSTISFDKASGKSATTSTTPRANRALNGVKEEPATATATTKNTRLESTKSISPKRKAPQEDEEEFTPDVEAEPEPPAKKQRTKGGAAGKAGGKANRKDEDMKALAARTAVGSLKKAMYIGAHISAAGGLFHHIVFDLSCHSMLQDRIFLPGT